MSYKYTDMCSLNNIRHRLKERARASNVTPPTALPLLGRTENQIRNSEARSKFSGRSKLGIGGGEDKSLQHDPPPPLLAAIIIIPFNVFSTADFNYTRTFSRRGRQRKKGRRGGRIIMGLLPPQRGGLLLQEDLCTSSLFHIQDLVSQKVHTLFEVFGSHPACSHSVSRKGWEGHVVVRERQKTCYISTVYSIKP